MLKGSCLCGKVRYQVSGPLGPMIYCHCSQCRKASGSTFTTNASVAVAITGVAGSRVDGRSAPPPAAGGDKPAGTVCFAITGPRPTKSTTKLFAGDRERIRRAAAYFALDLARRCFM